MDKVQTGDAPHTESSPRTLAERTLVQRHLVTKCLVSAGKPTRLEEGVEGTEHNAVCLRYDLHLSRYLRCQLIDSFLDSLRHYLCSSARMNGEDDSDIYNLSLDASQKTM